MELTSDVMFNLALNAIGYLAAGAFGVVVASIIKMRRQAAPSRAEDGESTRPAMAGAASDRGRVQFIDLGGRAGERTEAAAVDASTDAHPKARRDRAEVLRMARQMLKAGAGPERVMQVLPVSETELGLLTYGGK